MLVTTIKQIYAIALSACILFISASGQCAEQAPETPVDPSQDDSQASTTAPTTDTKLAPMALLIENDLSGEALWLGDETTKFASLFRPSSKAQEIAALIINPDFASLTRHDALHSLHQYLPDFGVSTLSLPLPNKPNPTIPPRSSNNDISNNDTSSNDTSSKDGSGDYEENLKQYTLSSQQRILAGINFLKEKNYSNVIIVFSTENFPSVVSSWQEKIINSLDWVVIDSKQRTVPQEIFNQTNVVSLNLLTFISATDKKEAKAKLLRDYTLAGFNNNIDIRHSSELNTAHPTKQLSKTVKGWLLRLNKSPR